MEKNQKIEEILKRGVAEIVDKNHLEEKLKSGEKLRVKLGIDPTGAKLHLGHALPLWKLRAFQELGHQVVLIIGDFTGLIGDTSDKDAERPMLSEQQVAENMKDYLKQAGKILDSKKLETHYNSEWLKPLSYYEVLKQADQFGLNEFISRDNISRRLEAGKRVSLRETYYPLLQGYDSVAIKADVELGAIDQRFNLLAGRTLQKYYKQELQDIMMFEYLMGADGRKMSKSWGNVINVTDEPNDMFGKVMAINDDLIGKYFEYATQLPMGEVEVIEKELKSGTNPRDLKKRLAEEIVTLYHGKQAAGTAAREWEKVFSKKEKPTAMPTMRVKSQNIIELLVETKLAPSKTEARRLVQQKAVKYNDEVIDEWDTLIDLESGAVLQVGKRKFVRLRK